MIFVRRAVFATFSFAVATVPVSLSGQGLGRLVEVRTAIAAGNAVRAVTLVDSIKVDFPHHPNVELTRARALMAAGRPDDVERSLRALLKWDPRYLRFALNDSTLKPLSSRFSDVDVAALAARADSPLSKGKVWATVEERDLVLEGTAFDAKTRNVLFGSLTRSTVIAVTPDGKISDRVARGSNGLGSVAGIHVDSARGVLWVASNRRFDRAADSSRSALFAFEAATGKFLSKVVSPGTKRNFYNDMTTGRDGSVYLTDTEGGAVLMLKPGGTQLEPFTPIRKVDAPNGITISADGRHLFVADMDRITVVELESGESWRLAVPDTVNITGVDGLAFADGSLIAHHPLAFWRIARYQMDSSMRTITGRTFIERNTPDSRTSTTGEVAGDHYVYIGNSQIDRMNAGTIDAASMEPIRIYRVRFDN